MSYDNSSQEVLVGFNNDLCLNHSMNHHRKGFNRVYMDLPAHFANVKKLCSAKNRKGLLCGECMVKYGPSINSLHILCLECRAIYAILIFILSIFLITVFYVIVVIFRLNFTSGPMLGYTIFCQMSVVVIRSNVGLFYSLVNSMSSFGGTILHTSLGMSAVWWYFAVVFHVFPDVCLSQHMTGLQVASLDYIFVLYPLFLLAVTYVGIELHARNFRPVVYLWKPFHKHFVKIRRQWSSSDSIIHAYATFFFLSLSILTYSSFKLLYTTNVYNINGTVTTTVLVYQPTMKAFGSQHLPYAITAITLLFFFGFCPTLFLCLYSSRFFTKCFRLSTRKQLLLHIFANAFQYCYKDGQNGTYDFRFLSPVPMILYLSLALISVHSTNTKVGLTYTLFYTALFLVLSLAIALVKPYKSGYMNFSLSFHAAVIGLATGVIILWMEGHIISTQLVAEVFTFLVFLPHFFALMTAAYYILKRIHLTRRMIQLIREKILVIFCWTQEEGTRELLPDRLENSHLYRSISDT